MKIFNRGILKEPSQTIQVDSGAEFKGNFKVYFEKRGINLRISQTGRHRQQGLIESRNKSIGTALLKRQTAEELITGEPSTEWVDFLPTVIREMNKRFFIKDTWDDAKPDYKKIFADTNCSGETCNILGIGTQVRYQLDEPINSTGKKLFGKFRAGDIKWSLKPTVIMRYQLMSGQPPMYKLKGKTALYTCGQLQVVNNDSKLPPPSVQVKFTVEKLLDKKKIKGKIHYLVRWVGFKKADDTWEPRTEIIKQIPDMIKEYDKKK